jgi:hypothetical protein
MGTSSKQGEHGNAGCGQRYGRYGMTANETKARPGKGQLESKLLVLRIPGEDALHEIQRISRHHETLGCPVFLKGDAVDRAASPLRSLAHFAHW